jgi:hypothetical protein
MGDSSRTVGHFWVSTNWGDLQAEVSVVVMDHTGTLGDANSMRKERLTPSQ